MDAQTIRIIAIVALVLSQIFDWHSTLAFLRSGHGREGNGWLARFQKKVGPSRAMVLKGLAHLALVPVIWWLPPAGGAALVGAVWLVYGPMIARNYRLAKGK